MFDIALGIAGIALSIIFWALPLLAPKTPRLAVFLGVITGVLLLGLSFGLVISNQKVARTPTASAANSIGNVQSNTGIITQNQIGNNTIINQTKPPRTISEHALDKAVSILKSVTPPTKVILMCIMNNAEAYRYAQQWQAILNKAGWPVTKINSATWHVPPVGIYIETKDPGFPAANALYKAVESVDKKFKASLDPSLTDGELAIIIGTNPQ